MATIKPKDSEEEIQGQEGGSQTVTFGAPAPQQQAPGQTAQPAAEKTGSGSFVNLDKFISANAGKSGEFAQGVAGGVQEKVGKVESDIKEAADTFTRDVTDTYTAKGPTTATEIITPEEQEAASKVLSSGSISMPTFGATTAGVSDITAAGDQVTKLVEGTDNSAGLSNVTKDYYKSMDLGATSGELGFDRLLLGMDPGAKKTFTNLRGSALGDAGSLATAFKGAQTTADKAVTDVQAANKTARENLGTSIGNELSGISTAANTSTLATDVKREPWLAKLTPEEKAVVRNAQPQDLMTDEQLDRANALLRLSGKPILQRTGNVAALVTKAKNAVIAEAAQQQTSTDLLAAQEQAPSSPISLNPWEGTNITGQLEAMAENDSLAASRAASAAAQTNFETWAKQTFPYPINQYSGRELEIIQDQYREQNPGDANRLWGTKSVSNY